MISSERGGNVSLGSRVGGNRERCKCTDCSMKEMDKFYDAFWPVLTAIVLVGVWKYASIGARILGDPIAVAAIMGTVWFVGTLLGCYFVLKLYPWTLTRDCVEITVATVFFAVCVLAGTAVAMSASVTVTTAVALVVGFAILYVGVSITDELEQKQSWFWRKALFPVGLVVGFFAQQQWGDKAGIFFLGLCLVVQTLWTFAIWPKRNVEQSCYHP